MQLLPLDIESQFGEVVNQTAFRGDTYVSISSYRHSYHYILIIAYSRTSDNLNI